MEEIKRKLVSIRKIKNISRMDNADRLSVATVDGWQVVVNNGTFKENDLCVYFEIDSLIPYEHPALSFFDNRAVYEGKEWKRIRTIKLRGQLSQGLALPIEAFPEIFEIVKENPESFINHDFTDVVGVVKREEIFNDASVGSFPYFIRKTGENRIQNVWDDYKEKYKDLEFVPTLKMDGSSLTVAYVNNPSFFVNGTEEGTKDQTFVCSHNLILKEFEEGQTYENKEGITKPVLKSPFHKAVDAISLREKMAKWGRENNKQIALQAELLGPKIAGNSENFETHTLRAFYIYFIDDQRLATPSEFNKICKELGVDKVTEYKPMKVFEVFKTLDEILDFAEGKSINAPKREGLVFKSVDLFNDHLVSFKVISNSFLLKKEKNRK